MHKHWFEISNGGSAVVEFSPVAGWMYLCEWGCTGYDYQTEREAMDALLNHDCERGC